ncbi:GroES-like protein [Cubamyces menziesii]|uniref:Enoyl reductase (ER) domain-containing protein n=1 Tax=Trametes cubensis TaxID=1111947 RepID=A0AAD7TZT6_9APHY|nr:GroES-like protein [Cubamyces menziesii]KAJ8489422.1 hypothetical protein ONZ51_g2955 [Trametes cubensis]
MPSQQKALVIEQKFAPQVVKNIDIPKPAAGEVLIRIEATALNPVDWKIHELGLLVEVYPATLGFDASGVVVELGEGVTEYAVGDKVIVEGWFDSEKRIFGTFQQYLAAPLTTVGKMPSNLTFEEAAAVPSGIATAGLPLYNQSEDADSARLTPFWEEGGLGKYAGKPIFVAGGSASVGQYAIQFARLSGFSPIITSASLHNADLLKSLGATHVVDRNLAPEALVQKVRELAGGHIDLVFDAVAIPDSTLAASYQITAPGGQLVVVVPFPIPGEDKSSGRRVIAAHGLFQAPSNFVAGKALLSKIPELFESGQFKPNRIEVLPGGLAGITAGLNRLRDGKISAVKLVVKPQDTED